MLVNFIQDLTIREVGQWIGSFRGKVIVVALSRLVPWMDHSPPSVTGSTCLNLRFGVASLELVQTVTMLAIPKERVGGREFDVETSRTVTGLATDIDFGKRGVILATPVVEVLLQVRRVAIGTHEVPPLSHAGPVEFIIGTEFLMDVGGGR
jgi:hypothetical protein